MHGTNEGMTPYEIVTTALLIVTFISTTIISAWALYFSAKSIREAEKNTKIAQDALEDSRKLAAETAKESQARIELEKQTSQAQIDALKKQGKALEDQVELMKKQFEAQNRPFLDITYFELYFKPNQPQVMRYRISNLGNYPVIFTAVKHALLIGHGDLPNFEEILNNTETSEQSYPISKESPYTTADIQGNVLEPVVFESVVRGDDGLYWCGEVDYINQLDNTRWKFIYVYQILRPHEDVPAGRGREMKFISRKEVEMK